MQRKNFLALVVVGGALVAGGCGGPAVVPTSYDSFSDKHNTFKMQAPGGWTSDSGGNDKKYSWAVFASGGAKIAVDVDGMGALILRTAETGINPMAPGGAGLSLDASKVHWLENHGFEERLGVKEEKPSTLETGLGEVHRSEFASAGGSGGLRGYRATAVNGDQRIQIVCSCPAAEWDTLKPVFDKVIGSLTP